MYGHPQQQQQQHQGYGLPQNVRDGSNQRMSSLYDNNYGRDYEMSMPADQMNSMNAYGPPHSQMHYQNQSYNQAPGMEPLMSPSMGNYGNAPLNEMQQMPSYDPYDDSFGSEPPVGKRKGKGRPKKDPSMPKKEKKARQPRIPKAARGRGRSGSSNESHLPTHPSGPPPPPPLPPNQMYPSVSTAAGGPQGPSYEYDNNYQINSESSEMYPTLMNQSCLQPSQPPMQMNMSSMSTVLPPLPTNQQTGPQMAQLESQVSPSEVVSQGPQEMFQQNSESVNTSNFDSTETKGPPSVMGNNNQSNLSLMNDSRYSNEQFNILLNSQMINSSESSGEALRNETVPCDDMYNNQPNINQVDSNLFKESTNAMIPSNSECLPIDQPLSNLNSRSCSTAMPNLISSATSFPNLSNEVEGEEESLKKSKGKGKGKKRKAKQSLDEGDILAKEEENGEANQPKKKRKAKKKKSKEEEEDLGKENELNETVKSEDQINLTLNQSIESVGANLEDSTTCEDVADKDKPKKNKKAKPKQPKLKEAVSKNKKKLPKLALKFGKKKARKRLGSSDISDVEKTPPPSPQENDNGTLKRRSARNTKRQKYNDDIELDLSDEDSNSDEKKESKQEEGKLAEPQVLITSITDDKMVVEKVMASRMGVREIEQEPNEVAGVSNTEEKPQTIEVEEFYVKYKNLSYLHCEWKTEEELEKGDKRVGQKLKRFKQKKDASMFDFLDDELFNPDYVEVDRILDVNEVEEEIVDAKSEVQNEDEEDGPEDAKDEDEKAEKTEKKEKEEEKENKNKDEIKSKDKGESEANTTEDGLKDESKIKFMDVDQNVKAEESNDKSENSFKTEIDDKEESELETKIEVKENDETIIFEHDDDTEKTKQNLNENGSENKGESEKPKRIVRHYLVKWRSLSYEECTWELEDDIDPLKIQHFWKFKNLPPKDKLKPKKRPKASEWKKLEASPIYKNGNTLREYQLEGVNWLTFCWYNGHNCILADEMGLGKTIQSITFIQEMVNYGLNGPFLVIAPLSTIGNWQREFETWTDLNVITYHGSSTSRNLLSEYEMYYKKENGEKYEGVYKFQVMITTFEIVLTDCLELREFNWRCCIIDEAHRLKNRNCKLLEGLRLLDMEQRVLLTGTPLQNNVEELFSLLNFLEPSQFSSSDLFMQEFGDLKTENQVDKLKAILKPMMLRRLKEDVEKSLAPKEETIIEVELTNVQKKYYRAILERNFQFLTKGNTTANVPNLMNTMMELRKCCIHPYLINGAEEQVLYEYKSSKGDNTSSQLEAMIQASGKLVLIDKLLPRLREDGHRVLIFSQMVRCLDILEDYLVQKRYPFERIDGRVRGNMRQAAIDRFCKPDSDRFVFLLCTRAGGLGINLTAADTVIIFDSDWNPQNDLQAQARCHRIGQSKMVKVYRLICRNTYEREMFDKASLKLGLDRAVLQSMNTQKSPGIMDTGMSKNEVEDLLRKGAYGAIMDDDNAGDKFCEEDIEQILQRRTHVITIESEQKGSTFSKASFASSDNRSDIEIDDPNFWEKWAKKAHLDVDELKGKNELIVQEPRKRTQTKRFGQDDSLLEISDVDSSDDDDDSLSTRTRGSKGRLKSKKGRRGKGSPGYERDEYLEDFAPGNWTKAECYQVEKGLLSFGWGRAKKIQETSNFKRHLTEQDVEDVARAIITFCLQNCRGDDKKREVSFFWDMIAPSIDNAKENTNETENDLNDTQSKNRKTKKVKKTENEDLQNPAWVKEDEYNPELLLVDEQYRKHLFRSANK